MGSGYAKAAVLVTLLMAGMAAAWDFDYAWHDAAAPTAGPTIKPGGGGIYGTGSQYEGGVQCDHCHLPFQPPTALDASVTFNPALTGGHYAPNTRYFITVRMLNEVHGKLGGGPALNSFAGMFEDANGNRVGVLESDFGGLIETSCQVTAPSTYDPSATTFLYADCHGILGRYGGYNTWSFYWTSPASSAGTLTFNYGVVDGNDNDRCVTLTLGPDDPVKMGKVTLLP